MIFVLIRDITYASTIATSELITKYNVQFILGFYLIQIIAAPFQAAYSDHSCRRKSLIFAFTIITISHGLLCLAVNYGVVYLILSLVLSGLLGNSVPICIAGLMDIDYLRNVKKLMVVFSITLAVAWIIYEYGLYLVGTFNFLIFTTACCFTCIFLAVFMFKDPRDKDPSPKRFNFSLELKGISNILRQRWLFLVVKGYLFTEIVYFTLFYYHVLESTKLMLLLVVTAYSVGYIIGTIITMYLNLSLYISVRTGLLSALLCVCLLLLGSFLKAGFVFFIVLSGLLSLAYGIMDPCIYTFIGVNQPAHMRGKVFGVVDSTDNLSEMTTSIIFLLVKPSISIMRVIAIILLILSYFYFKESFKKHSFEN